MGIKLPGVAMKFIDGTAIGYFSTLMRDGSPQVSSVWVDRDGDVILVNTSEGRAKPRNTRRDKRVAICVPKPDNPYEMVTFRGKVMAVTNEGAEDHIDKMAKKYLGQDKYPYRQPGEKRVLIKMEPTHAASWPPDLIQSS